VTGGFETGSDYVAAKVNIDVDGQGIQSLREMSQEIDRLRTSTEAASRTGASFVSYIQQITQAAKQATEAHRDLSAQLERTAEMQARGAATSGGSAQALTSSRLAPGGYVDPWAGMGAGMGGSRSPSPSDVQAQIDPTRQLDPRKYLNAQAGRYNLQSGDLPSSPGQADWGSHANRVAERDRAVGQQQQATSPAQAAGGGQSGQGGEEGSGAHVGNYGGYGRLASNIANEMRPGGGSWGGVAKALHGGMQGLGKHLSGAASGTGTDTALAAMGGSAEGAEGMGIGSLVGGAAGGVGLALGGLAAVEKGGAMYQGYKNMGAIQGQGAGAGFASEAAIRTMALNPFLSTEQSRQIITAGLTEGYSGKQFDTVTQFMASNLKDMNMSVAESTQLLRKNVNEGGQSVAGFAASMAMLKKVAAGGNMSQADVNAAFAQTSGSLVDQGVDGGTASQTALGALGGWNQKGDPMALAGVFPQAVGDIAGSPGGDAMLRLYGGANVPSGLNPTEVPAYMSAHGQDINQASSNVLKRFVMQMFNTSAKRQKGSRDYLNALRMFMQRLPSIGMSNSPMATSQNVAALAVDQILAGKDPAPEGNAARDKKATEINAGPTQMQQFGDVLSGIGDIFTDGTKQISAMLNGDNAGDGGEYDAASADFNKQWATTTYDMGAQASNPIMKNVIGQLGAGNIEVMDGGNASDLTGSKQQMEGLTSGKLKWRQKGTSGDGMLLKDTPGAGSVNSGSGGGNQTVSFNPATIQINIKSDGSATASPNPLSLNAQQVNAGQGTATMSNPEATGFDKGGQVF
jgi:hypothetical protein